MLIILSVYFLINPSACSNLLQGKQTSDTASSQPQETPAAGEPQQHITSSEQSGKTDEMLEPVEEGKGVFDTNTMHEQQAEQPSYSQDDLDYAKASYYVELEQEYAKTHPVHQDASREISFMVMEKFRMTQSEWESFLARATASDLFSRVRRDLAQ